MAHLVYLWLVLALALECCPRTVAQSKSARRAGPDKARPKQVLITDNFGDPRIWLDEDARWIITDEERAAFKQLKNGEELDLFIEQFWLRRDPTPDTPENEFKEEHYRRILFANEQFASRIPGWKTDRGRIYIVYGPPDNVETHSIDAGCTSGAQQDATCIYPAETWHYVYLEGIGQQVSLDFVDTCGCGEYHMKMPESEKDAILHVPFRSLTYDGAPRGDQIRVYVGSTHPPLPKFRDLEEVVTAKIQIHQFPLQVRTDFLKITPRMVMLSMTIGFDETAGKSSSLDQAKPGPINIYGRITTMTGRIAETFERTISDATEPSHLRLAMIPLRAGRYRLDVAVRDVNGDRVGTWAAGIHTPDYSEDQLAASSLILADCIAELSGNDPPSCPSTFVGTTELIARPAPHETEAVIFKQNENINMWMQAYNLRLDSQTHKPKAAIEYSISDIARKKEALHSSESTEQLQKAAEQITLKKTLPAGTLPPGKYNINIKVNDLISKQTITASAPITIQ